MKRTSRGAIFWGAALVTAGLVILAIQQGYVSDDILNEASRWWPLILIGAGVAIIFSGVLGGIATALAGMLLGVLVGGLIGGGANFSTACGTGDPGPLRAFEEGSFAGLERADVRIELNCVKLEVAGGAGKIEWSVEADEDAAANLDLSSGPSSLELRSKDSMVAGTDPRRHVALVVPAGEGTNLTSQLNAGNATFDLADGQWGEINIDGNAVAIQLDLSDAEADGLESSLNAGSMGIQLSENSRVDGIQLSANAGEFHVCAPDGIGLQIIIGSNLAASHNLEEEGLDQDGDMWRTPGYASADNQIEITFSGNAAAFTLNPEGGCS